MSYRIIFILLFLIFNSNKDFSQVTFTSSNVPIIVINTNGQTILDEPKITADMGIIDNGPGQRNNLTDPFNAYNSKIGIEIRGHSSQMFEKKQYGVETRDSSGNDIKVSLLGLPEESDWVLNASYIDKTFMRNVITYKLSNDLGRYASRTRYCEVVINGNYFGLYILQEKIKRDKNRVNIKKMSTTDITGDAVTGGYIIKIDRVDPGDKYWTSAYPAVYQSTKAPVTYVHEYPKAADIVSVQQNYIKNYINTFETIMYSAFYRDPFAGYYNLIDVDSFVDYYLINEFTKNTDAYRLSAFLYKNRDSEGGKLMMGPVWDYDICFGLADYDDGFNPAGWQAYKHYDGLWSSPFWTTNLMIDPVFKNKLAKRWNEVKNNTFSINSLTNFMEENILLTAEARERNFAKWKDLFNPAVYTWPNKNRFSNYEDEVNYLKTWISQRTAWLNNNLPSDYSDVEWLTPDLSKINFEIGKATKIRLANFVKSKTNVPLINFQTLDIDCKPELIGDTLWITVQKPGNYLMKGTGQRESNIVSVSPDYKINVVSTSVDYNNLQIPLSFELFQNYPNPFNPTTTISFSVPRKSHIIIKVFDIVGREVVTLINEERLPGNYNINFDGSNLPSGIYFCSILAGSDTQAKKMVLLK